MFFNKEIFDIPFLSDLSTMAALCCSYNLVRTTLVLTFEALLVRTSNNQRAK